MMTPERWQQVKELLGPALELDPAKRTDYLDKACGSDASLREELERLLAAEKKAGGDFLNDPLIPDALNRELSQPADVWIGRRVGPYQIVEEIGVGGMGEVYRAVRADDQYHKQVAIKLVRSGQDSSFVLGRFKNERQILAGLDHPNIARLLDGGTTEEGVPYFVMELIEGQVIDQYCDARKLATAERLKLFLQVCSAVQYAHQRLIIHRDIKPGNILVTSEGVPKLLDFGIAKILDADSLAAGFEPTVTMFRMLTPEYASPEQIRGEPITTSSDVYALGVVLYELLTGHSPYRLSTRKPHEMARAICESDPERPSTVVGRTGTSRTRNAARGIPPATRSAARDDAPEKLRKHLSGDLDTIVLMALRKEPQRRYASVEQFAEDIRRHLADLPVIARKDTLGYRTSKFITRHKVGVAAAALVSIALLAALGVTLREARIAQRRFNDVRGLANSLIFEIHDSIQDLPGATAARKLIVERAQEYLDNLARESGSDPALLRELATAYEKLANVQGDAKDANLGDTAKARQNFHKAVDLRRAALALEPQNRDLRREVGSDYANVAVTLNRQGDEKAANESMREAFLILEPLAVSNPADPKIQFALAKAYERKAGFLFAGNNQDDARTSYEKSLQIYERLAKADPKNDQYRAEVSFGHKHLGSLLAVQNHLEEGLDHYRRALAIDEAQLAAHPDSLSARYFITYTYSDTGWILGKRGDLDAALSYYHKALDIRAAMVAADPQDTRARAGLANTYGYIGQLLQGKGDDSGALESLKKAFALRDALAQSDPANEQIHLKVAETQALIGEQYAAMATKTHVARRKQTALCREARRWLGNSLSVFTRMQAEGKLPSSEDARANIKSALEQCDRLLAARPH
jgi:serine/threonine protein kinase